MAHTHCLSPGLRVRGPPQGAAPHNDTLAEALPSTVPKTVHLLSSRVPRAAPPAKSRCQISPQRLTSSHSSPSRPAFADHAWAGLGGGAPEHPTNRRAFLRPTPPGSRAASSGHWVSRHAAPPAELPETRGRVVQRGRVIQQVTKPGEANAQLHIGSLLVC